MRTRVEVARLRHGELQGNLSRRGTKLRRRWYKRRFVVFFLHKMRVQLWNRLLPSQDASPIVEEFSVFDKKGDGDDILVQMDSAMLLEENQRGKIFGFNILSCFVLLREQVVACCFNSSAVDKVSGSASQDHKQTDRESD